MQTKCQQLRKLQQLDTTTGSESGHLHVASDIDVVGSGQDFLCGTLIGYSVLFIIFLWENKSLWAGN